MESSLKQFCYNLYRKLPVVREVSRIEPLLRNLPHQQRLSNIISVTQALEAIKTGDSRYRDPRRLLAHGAQYWSQNYEDGMIAEIFRRIGTASRTFLEIGVGDGSENNTTALLSAGWSGWWIDGSKDACRLIEQRLQEMPDMASRLKVRQALVSPANIVGLLAELGVPSEIDLFSLDIDLDTYHIWKALNKFKPRVVVVEYNAGIPPGQAWIHPYKTGRFWDGTQAFGASLKAYEQLGDTFGYNLVGCDIIGVNAFFVRKDLCLDHFAMPFTAENHYEPIRYYLSHRLGHPAEFYGESHKVLS